MPLIQSNIASYVCHQMGKSIETVISFTGKVYATKKKLWVFGALRQSRSTILVIDQKDIRKWLQKHPSWDKREILSYCASKVLHGSDISI